MGSIFNYFTVVLYASEKIHMVVTKISVVVISIMLSCKKKIAYIPIIETLYYTLHFVSFLDGCDIIPT